LVLDWRYSLIALSGVCTENPCLSSSPGGL